MGTMEIPTSNLPVISGLSVQTLMVVIVTITIVTIFIANIVIFQVMKQKNAENLQGSLKKIKLLQEVQCLTHCKYHHFALHV